MSNTSQATPSRDHQQESSSGPHSGPRRDRRFSTNNSSQNNIREPEPSMSQSGGGGNHNRKSNDMFRRWDDLTSVLKVGFVFDIRLAEPLGRPSGSQGSQSTRSATALTASTGSAEEVPTLKQAQQYANIAGFFVKERPMVVVEKHEGRLSCCALRSYEGKGFAGKIGGRRGSGWEKLRWQIALIYSMDQKGAKTIPEQDESFPTDAEAPIFYMDLWEKRFGNQVQIHWDRALKENTLIDFSKVYNVDCNSLLRPRGLIKGGEQLKDLAAFHAKVRIYGSWRPNKDHQEKRDAILREQLERDIKRRHV